MRWQREIEFKISVFSLNIELERERYSGEGKCFPLCVFVWEM